MKTRGKIAKGKAKPKVLKGKKGKTKRKEIIYKAGDCIALNQEDGDNKFTICILKEDVTDEKSEFQVFNLKTEDSKYYLLPDENSRTFVAASTNNIIGPTVLQRTTDANVLQLAVGMKDEINEALGDDDKKEKLREHKDSCNLEDFL